MQAVECGYGHKLIDGDNIMYTSQEAIVADLTSLCRMLNKSVEMLSKLIDVKPKYIMEDLYDMTGCNLWEEAMKAVLAKQGKNVYLPTLTEEHFDAARRNKHDAQTVKHGRWIWDSNAPHREHGAYKCSNCGYHSDFEENYCYNCGVRMDGDAK